VITVGLIRFQMRASEKLEVIDRIARELQSRFTYYDIDIFLAEFGTEVTSNSKWVYSKEALKNVPMTTIAKIVEDLGLERLQVQHGIIAPPRNWRDTHMFKLFISHIAKHKDRATRLKDCLFAHAISGFVAHEDIHPTLEWQKEIERALFAMDAFLAIHTPGFKDSFWTQQEIGFALGRGVKIISFKMGEDPTGFISKHQALPRQSRTAEEIAKEVDALLAADELTADKLESAKITYGVIARDGQSIINDLNDDIPF
jgi:signal recognition particle subunit SEC65